MLRVRTQTLLVESDTGVSEPTNEEDGAAEHTAPPSILCRACRVSKPPGRLVGGKQLAHLESEVEPRPGDGSQECLGVGGARVLKHIVGGSGFDDAP